MELSDILFPSGFEGVLLSRDHPGDAWLVTPSAPVGGLFTTADYATFTGYMAVKRLVMDYRHVVAQTAGPYWKL
jgi:hypothetical protein